MLISLYVSFCVLFFLLDLELFLDFDLLFSDFESELDLEELSELSEELDKLELSISLSIFLAFFSNSYRSMSSQATRSIFIGLCSPLLNLLL